jgi:hypothetical protein
LYSYCKCTSRLVYVAQVSYSLLALCWAENERPIRAPAYLIYSTQPLTCTTRSRALQSTVPTVGVMEEYVRVSVRRRERDDPAPCPSKRNRVSVSLVPTSRVLVRIPRRSWYRRYGSFVRPGSPRRRINPGICRARLGVVHQATAHDSEPEREREETVKWRDRNITRNRRK